MPRYTHWPRPRPVVLLAAVLVLGLALSTTYLLMQSDERHRGGVLTIVTGTDLWFPRDAIAFDPAIQNSEWHSMLAPMITDGLVGFRRAGGARGNRIVPDLATALPDPTDGGLTYTFHLRKGVRYSTGRPVLAGDIRRGIERTVVHSDTHSSAYYSATIMGAQRLSGRGGECEWRHITAAGLRSA